MKASFLMVLHYNVKRRNAKTHEALHYLVGYVLCICYSMVTLEILHSIDRMHKWRPKKYSFVYVLIRLTSLVCMYKIQKKCCLRATLVSTYNTYIRLLTTSPKGLFSANYKEKKIKIKTYTNYLKLQLQLFRISFLPLKFI